MLVEMVLPSGAVMLVDGHATGGPRDVGLSPKIDVAAITQALVEFASVLTEAGRAMSPEESEITFSVGVDAATGGLIAFLGGASASSSAEVRLLWKRSP